MARPAADAFFEAGGQWLRSLNPSIPDVYVDTGSSYPAAWFVPPAQHFRDIFIATICFVPMLIIGFIYSKDRRSTGWVDVIPAKAQRVSHAAVWANKHKENIVHGADGVDSSASDGAVSGGSSGGGNKRDTEEACTGAAAKAVLAALDYILRAVTTICFCAIIYYKTAVPKRWAFLLMPCHIQNAFLVYLSFAPRRGRVSAFLWAVSLYTYFGTFLALLLPDTRNQEMPLELINFWTQHVALLLLPLVWILRRRYALPGGLAPFLVSWAFFVLQESHLHLAASVATGYNVVYVMVPSKPQMRLHGAGGAYRYWWTFLELPLLLAATRYGIVEAILAAAGMNRFRSPPAPQIRDVDIKASPTAVDADAVPAAPIAADSDGGAAAAPGRTTRRRKQA